MVCLCFFFFFSHISTLYTAGLHEYVFKLWHLSCIIQLTSNKPDQTVCLSLLGLSCWCQLHTGQLGRLGNTNGSMKALSTNSDVVKRILINHFAESQLHKRKAQNDAAAFNKATNIIQTSETVLLKQSHLVYQKLRGSSIKCVRRWIHCDQPACVSFVCKLPFLHIHRNIYPFNNLVTSSLRVILATQLPVKKPSHP